jgi:hypothetical protein
METGWQEMIGSEEWKLVQWEMGEEYINSFPTRRESF